MEQKVDVLATPFDSCTLASYDHAGVFFHRQTHERHGGCRSRRPTNPSLPHNANHAFFKVEPLIIHRYFTAALDIRMLRRRLYAHDQRPYHRGDMPIPEDQLLLDSISISALRTYGLRIHASAREFE
jgi:hypothetical protein